MIKAIENTVRDYQDEFLTTTQAASFLNISLSTLKKIIKKGMIRTFKTPGGHHRIYKKELLDNLQINND